ncbi:MAG: hypothetical protein V1777_05755 [Candidatus Micrarchaeota archaeon]
MLAEKILGKTPVSLTKAQDLLKTRTKDVTPTYEQDMSLKYTGKFSRLTPAKSEKLVHDLMKIDGVSDWLAVKIADVLPVEKTVLELLLAKNIKLSPESQTQIVDTVKKYV